MSEQDKNELIKSLMRLRKRCCGGVSAACMTTNARMAKDNAEFQKLIQGVKALIADRDEARREIMNSVIDQACSNEEIEEEYRKRGWKYLKENTNE